LDLREGFDSSMGRSIEAREVLVGMETLTGTSGGLLRGGGREMISSSVEEEDGATYITANTP